MSVWFVFPHVCHVKESGARDPAGMDPAFNWGPYVGEGWAAEEDSGLAS